MMTRRTLLRLGTWSTMGALGTLAIPTPSRAAPGFGRLQTTSPLNWQHPLAKGLIGMFVCDRQLSGGGTVWRNLAKRFNFTLTNMALPATATSGWGKTTGHRGGIADLRIDGTNDYFQSPDSTLWTGLTACTIACWAKIDIPHATLPQTVIRKWHSVSPWISFDVAAMNAPPKSWYVEWVDTASVHFLVTASTTLVASVWYHLICTYKVSTPCEIYRYGIRNSSSVVTAGANALLDSDQTVVGGSDSGGGLWLAGAVDHLMFWNRALSRHEALDLYNESSQGFPTLCRWETGQSVPFVSTAPAGGARSRGGVY
jgi:hypothetical protein